MKELFRDILETVLFTPTSDDSLVILPESNNARTGNNELDGTFQIPFDLFPINCEVRTLPEGEAFLTALKDVLEQIRPSRLFIWPPLMASRHLSSEMRSVYPRSDLYEI